MSKPSLKRFIQDPDRLSELLQKNLGSGYSREIYLIVRPLKVNIIDSLSFIKDNKKLNSKLLPTINKIHSQEGFDEGEAKWAVYSWAFALDKVQEKEYYEINEFNHLRTDTPPEPPSGVSSAPIKDTPPTTEIAEDYGVPQKEESSQPMKDVSSPPIKDTPPTTEIAEVYGVPQNEEPTQPMKDVSSPPIKDTPPTTEIAEVYGVPQNEEPTQPMKDVSSPPIKETVESRPPSFFKNNLVRILLGVVVAVGIISFIIYITNSTDSNQAAEVTIDAPDKIISGQILTLDASGSRDPDGSITEYRWFYKVNNGSVNEVKTLKNASKIEFNTPLSGNNYSLQFQLKAKDNDGAYSKPVEKTISVEPDEIIVHIS